MGCVDLVSSFKTLPSKTGDEGQLLDQPYRLISLEKKRPSRSIAIPQTHTSTQMAQKCVHKGCGKVYTDPDEPCVYHPGPPEFHEGQKGKLSLPRCDTAQK